MVFVWESFLKISGWKSEIPPVGNLLRYLKYRRIGAESSRQIYCFALYAFCRFARMLPDGLIRLSKSEVEKLIEEFAYSKRESGCSPRTVNVLLCNLKTFFLVNGFKGEKELDIEFYHQPARGRVREDYVPTLDEALKMAECAKSLRDKTMILFMTYSGVRESTLLAIRFGDVRKELERGSDTLLIRIYPEMKKLVYSACKGNVEYFTFVPKKAVDVLRLYVAQKRERMGEIPDDYPLFSSEHNQLARKDRFKKPLSGRQLQDIVKRAAKDAGIEKWRVVHPHCLRKTCDTFLRSQMNDGSRLDMQAQIYLMGHTLPAGLQPYFDARIEDLRKEYSKLVAVPSDVKLKRAIEALKIVGEALRIHGVQHSSKESSESGAVKLDDASKAVQNFLEAIQRSNDNNEEDRANVHISGERKDLNPTGINIRLDAQERSTEEMARDPNMKPPMKPAVNKVILATKSQHAKNAQVSRTKQTTLNLFSSNAAWKRHRIT